MKAFQVSVPEADEDLTTALLWEAGTSGIEVKPAARGRVALLAYFPDPTDAPAIESALETIAGATVDAVPIPDVDWVARFRESFRSFEAGRFLIAPLWANSDPGPWTLVVDPGRAFGTGTHETTRLCLGALQSLAAARPLGRVLDVGTGTGILGIAAARLGARLAVGVDDDPEAVDSARHHARLNAVALHLLRANGGRALAPHRFDVVVANLTARILIEHASSLSSLLRPEGALVLSGLLDTDLQEVADAYAQLGAPEVSRDGEWCALLLRNPPG